MNYNAGQRLDRLPEASFHRRVAAMIGAGMFMDAFDLYMASGVMVALTASGWSTIGANALFASAGAFGALIGAFAAGWLGDKFGRRFSFQFNLLLFASMSIAAAIAPSIGWLIAFRFLMSIGLGAEIVVGYATMGEFVPPEKRGKWGAVIFFFATAALPVSTFLSYLIIPHFGWRPMFVIAGVGGLIIWSMRKNMPESPRWLESTGRHAEANAILDRIEAEVSKDHTLPTPASAPLIPTRAYHFLDLFKPPLLRSTFLGVTLNVVGLSVLYGFIIWLPTFFVKQGLSVGSSLGYSTVSAGGSLVGIFLASRFTDKLSRRKAIVALSLLSAVLGWLYGHTGSITETTVVGVVLITALYCNGAIGFATYVPELFPTELRLRGSGVASVAGRFAAIFAPQVVAFLFALNGNPSGVILTLVGLALVQALIVALFGIERTQHSLDEGFAKPLAA